MHSAPRTGRDGSSDDQSSGRPRCRMYRCHCQRKEPRTLLNNRVGEAPGHRPGTVGAWLVQPSACCCRPAPCPGWTVPPCGRGTWPAASAIRCYRGMQVGRPKPQRVLGAGHLVLRQPFMQRLDADQTPSPNLDAREQSAPDRLIYFGPRHARDLSRFMGRDCKFCNWRTNVAASRLHDEAPSVALPFMPVIGNNGAAVCE